MLSSRRPQPPTAESELLGVIPRWKGRAPGREQERCQYRGFHRSPRGPASGAGPQRNAVKLEGPETPSRDGLTQIQGCRLARLVVADSPYSPWGGLFGIKSR